MAKSTATASANVLANDLRRVYLLTFDSFAVTIGDITELDGINHRYARELVGVLTNNNLVAEVEVNGEWGTYQTTPDTYDNITRDEAESRIDEFIKSTIPNATPPKESKMATATATKSKPDATPTEFRKCGCGCGANVSGKAMYKPGHDARHAGNVARLAHTAHQSGQTDLDEIFAYLPTAALQEKARAMVTKWIERDEAKAAKAAAKASAKVKDADVPEFTEGTMKKGRWEYPTRVYPGGVVEVNSKRDGSGEWVPVD